MKTRLKKITTLFLLFVVLSLDMYAQVQRFPKPDFDSGYEQPVPIQEPARSLALEYLDVIVLIVALSLASYFVLKSRSRKKVFWLMIFSLVYFGFWRKGCVCSVGSIQNVAYSLFNSGYAIPITVVLFFVLPLIFTLFFGRTFCAAVCPLGAMQDAVVLKPVNVPKWLAETLSILPYIYLSLAILFAVTGAGFIICQYDPFVGFFRFGAEFNMIAFGVSLLILGTVVARPYCRFLCPYGVLLNWMSRLSKWHAKITPDECINCRLCEESCPFGAINMPNPDEPKESSQTGTRRLGILIVLFPIILFSSGWIGSSLYKPLSRQHHKVSLAEEMMLENSGQRVETTLETRTFRSQGQPLEELLVEARAIQKQFKIGGWILGLFIGLIIWIKLYNLSIYKKQTEYEPDNGTCFSCARCYSYCPIEHERLEKLGASKRL